MPYILAIDEGTTSARTVVYNNQFREIAKAQKEFTQIYPQPGWVEHDAEEIWQTQLATITNAITQANISVNEIVCVGITNQRETIVVWEKKTGKPIYNAIVWQDRRTAEICENLKQKGFEKTIQTKTGLVLDAYFSATKIFWILENVKGAREMANRGELCCGTIDTWLIWKLTKGKTFATDASNASRTMLFNIHTNEWDNEILELFNIPVSMLPEVKNTVDDFGEALFGEFSIPITAVAGDQQAALFGQGCFEKGFCKNTYGTGCFMLMNTGTSAIYSKSKMLTTIAWRLQNKTTYALEGSVFIAGAVIQWLRDALQIIQQASETETIASSLPDNGGVYFIPAFTGLGAPHWEMEAKGSITGLTRGSGKAHIVRAALESIAYQVRDVFDAMQQDAGMQIKELRVDGGASENNWLMQFQSDILQTQIVRNAYIESTALGVAMLAGIRVQMFTIGTLPYAVTNNVFYPGISADQASAIYQGWANAVQQLITK